MPSKVEISLFKLFKFHKKSSLTFILLTMGPALLHDLLFLNALHIPEKIAIRTFKRDITYFDLSKETILIAHILKKRGVKPGDRVGILLKDGIDVVKALMAISRISGIFYILSIDIKVSHLKHIILDSSPSIIITRPEIIENFDLSDTPVLLITENMEDLNDDEIPIENSITMNPVALIYTSGSTGMPKAVVSSHDNILFATRSIQQILQLRNDDVIGDFLPLSFDYGLYQIFLAFNIGATIAIESMADAGIQLIHRIRDWSINVFPVVPTLLQSYLQLCKRQKNYKSNLRIITNTGASLSKNFIKEFRNIDHQCKVFLMYGLTECKRVSILPFEKLESKSDSVGLPIPNTECFIIDKKGNLLGSNIKGELIVRGPHVMLGYWGDKKLSALRYKNLKENFFSRVLHTGDICSIDEDGYIYFHGRKDDIFKFKGYRLSSIEIETVFFNIPNISDVVVFPPNEQINYTAFVVTTLSIDEVLEQIRLRLEDYKIPQDIRLIDKLPKNTNGKTDKKSLLRILTL